MDCKSLRLKNFEIPVVEEIGEEAFVRCNSLVKVNLPQAKTIGQAAFQWCINLESVEMPVIENLYDKVFWFCESFSDMIAPYQPAHELVKMKMLK